MNRKIPDIGLLLSQSATSVLASGVDINYEVPERSGKIISTGTPFRLVYGVIHL